MGLTLEWQIAAFCCLRRTMVMTVTGRASHANHPSDNGLPRLTEASSSLALVLLFPTRGMVGRVRLRSRREGRSAMQVAGRWLQNRATRAGVAAAGLMALLALQPEPAHLVEAASIRGSHARALVLSEQARRYLSLSYRSYPTEFMGCMIGEIHGNAVIVGRIAPADVEPQQSTRTRVVPQQTCEDAGWAGTVGMIHSHPDGERCWYYFPGTRVATSDAQSFGRQPYPVDAIMCGDRVVWISRDMVQQQVLLSPADGQRAAAAVAQPRGNRVHAGSGE